MDEQITQEADVALLQQDDSSHSMQAGPRALLSSCSW